MSPKCELSSESDLIWRRSAYSAGCVVFTNRTLAISAQKKLPDTPMSMSSHHQCGQTPSSRAGLYEMRTCMRTRAQKKAENGWNSRDTSLSNGRRDRAAQGPSFHCGLRSAVQSARTQDTTVLVLHSRPGLPAEIPERSPPPSSLPPSLRGAVQPSLFPGPPQAAADRLGHLRTVHRPHARRPRVRFNRIATRSCRGAVR